MNRRITQFHRQNPHRQAGPRHRQGAGYQGPRHQSGKLGWIALWLLGIPIPILLVLFLVRGCT